MQNPAKLGFSWQENPPEGPPEVPQILEGQQQQKPSVEILDVLGYDRLDIIILNKFLKNTSYTIKNLHEELLAEKKTAITLEGVRHRLEEKYIPRNLIRRIRTFAVVYDLNDSAIMQIKFLTRRFVVMLGVSDIL